MFARSIIELIDPLLFILSSYFLFVLIKKKDVGLIYKIIWLLPLVPLIVRAVYGYNLTGYNWDICEVVESSFSTNYIFFIDLFYMTSAILFAIWSTIKGKGNRKEITIASVGVCSFIVLFFIMEYVLTGYLFGNVFDYNYFLYAFFGMPVLIIFLAYLAIKYNEFNTKLITAEILVVGIVSLIFAQYFFVTGAIAYILNTVAFIGIIIFGNILTRSVRHEIEAKEALKIANERQAETTSLITHQIRGSFADTMAGLKAMEDGDYGALASEQKELVEQMIEIQEKGRNEVETFLKAQRIESGTVQYDLKTVDLKEMVLQLANQGRARAEGKKLQYNVNIEEGNYTVKADPVYLSQVIANLIDNAIRYTPAGAIEVRLAHRDNNVLYSVKDSGVGISEEDKKKLFTKYGHGKDSRKVNTESTGLGLFIVKGIVDAHHGKIWEESAGEGKGTIFFVELPLSA